MEFSHPLWLIAALAVPLAWILFYQMECAPHSLEKFIDKHLLPYLLINSKREKGWQKLLTWSLVWVFLTVALAGPRWNYREVETLTPDRSLVIILDLSDSMNATDVKPSRLIRAKQKIEDLLNQLQGTKIALVAFAADPHMITPLTDDKETIRHLLASLDTSVVYVQGSRLASTLEMAHHLLEKESHKAILVISDGGYEDTGRAISLAKKLKSQGVQLYAMGIGTEEGAPIKGTITKLDKEKMKELGQYLESHEELVLESGIAFNKKQKIWEEHFYLFLLPVLPILLFWMRKGYLIPLLLFSFPAEAYFKNSEELGVEAIHEGRYEEALQTLQDPYRKGVAAYKAEHFAEAEKFFRQSHRPEVDISARYNLGNALAEQQKFKEAIGAYEDVLKKDPQHIKAKENLELLKKMLDEQKQQENEKKEENNEKEPQQKNSGDDSQQESENEQNEQQQEDSKKEEQDSPQGNRGQEEQAEQDRDADLWLKQIATDPKDFLKNKFFIESKKNNTKEGIDPW